MSRPQIQPLTYTNSTHSQVNDISRRQEHVIGVDAATLKSFRIKS